MKKACILGWYGHDNAGDQAYKTTIPKFLKEYQCTFTDTIKEDADIFVLGGGNVVSTEFLYKLRNKTEKYLLSVSVTENTDFKALKSFKRIFVRDLRSQQILLSKDILCTLLPDLAFLSQPDPENGKTFIKNAFQNKDLYENLVTIVLNSHLIQPSDNLLARDFINFHSVINQLVSVIDSTNASFLFLPFGSKEPYDDRVTNSWLASRCKFWQKNAVVHEQVPPQTLIDVIACSNAMISTRLHASIFSCIGGTPFVDLTHHTKNEGFVESINRKHWSISYWQFDAKKCSSLINGFLKDKSHGEELISITRQQRDRIREVGDVLSI